MAETKLTVNRRPTATEDARAKQGSDPFPSADLRTYCEDCRGIAGFGFRRICQHGPRCVEETDA